MLDGVLISHLLLWSIGGLVGLGAVLMTMAVWSMGRSAYRGD